MDRVEKPIEDAARWLKHERLAKGWESVSDFASAVGVRDGTAYNWENPKSPGRPKEEYVEKIAEALGLPTDEVRRGLGYYVTEASPLDDIADVDLIIEAVRRIEKYVTDDWQDLMEQFPTDVQGTLTDAAFGILRYNTTPPSEPKPRRTG